MSSRIETAAAATASRNAAQAKKESPNPVRVIGFDAERFQAPFALRCGALLIDYLILVAAPAIAFLLASSRGLSGVKLWRDPSLSIGWLIALLVLVSNFIILPVISGRTIGKFATGLRGRQQSDVCCGSAAASRRLSADAGDRRIGFRFCRI
jgi:uncharacterized membrane protein (DUF485 family)